MMMTAWFSAISEAAFALLVFPGFAFLFVCAMAFGWIDRRVIARFEDVSGHPGFNPWLISSS